ncbi:uncharacterized protein LOC104909419 [Meleagris gallopavo]|uniref:PHD finger protein 7 n=1 Tax=Meleagris gallopavo TaxID=9103 RepID=A0A803YL97_MELGA|nr:uncharacterized protein LOC104909419 [Meleagris gallopavo]
MTSNGNRKASCAEEPVCVLCGQADVDPDICGHMLFETGIRVHEFCLMFANIPSEARQEWPRTQGLPVAAITRKVKQANTQQCCVCGEKGAAITCAESGCARSFHLPCAVVGECISQYFGEHRSFCSEHRPRQVTQEVPAEGNDCLICLEPVGDSLSYHTMVCPACQHVWFHRACIQQQALSAGTAYFECPGCRDCGRFYDEMSTAGIRIPLKEPEWDSDEAYEPLLERHSRCDASECLYQGGREQAETRGPWELILCSSCAAEGTHRQCSHLYNTRDAWEWECDSCAGLGTASSTNTELAGPSTASQRVLGSSSSSMKLETFSSMPASQAALETLQSSQLPEHSDLPSVPETEQGTNGPRLSEDRATSEQLQGRCGSRQTAAPSAESDSHTSTRRRAPGSSRASPAAARRRRRRQQGGSRTRSRSPLQARAPSSQSRPRGRRGSQQMPAPGEQNSTRRSRSATSRSPRASRVPGRRRPSRQRGGIRTRSRSPLQARAPSSQSRPRGRRGSRQMPAPGEQSSTRRSRSATSRSPRASRAPGRRRPSRQRGRTRTQSPPSERRWAHNSRRSPQRGRARQGRPFRE